MRLQGTKVKADVESLKKLIQKKLDEDTSAHEKAVVKYNDDLDTWVKETLKTLAALSADDLKNNETASYQYGRLEIAGLNPKPRAPDAIDDTHTRLLNMLELTDEKTLTLSLDSEFRRYLS